MVLLRLFLILFNAAVVIYLVYRLIQVLRQPLPPTRKVLILVVGVLLLAAPIAMFLRIFGPPAPQYFLLYPAAIGLFIYLIRSV